MVGHAGSSAGLYLADPTSPIPSHCASIVTTSTLIVIYRIVSQELLHLQNEIILTKDLKKFVTFDMVSGFEVLVIPTVIMRSSSHDFYPSSPNELANISNIMM